MNDAARRLRAQKAFSTDPDYLERLARAEEARDRVRDREEPSGDGEARELCPALEPGRVTVTGRLLAHATTTCLILP